LPSNLSPHQHTHFPNYFPPTFFFHIPSLPDIDKHKSIPRCNIYRRSLLCREILSRKTPPERVRHRR
jgi:hypothetical protein